MVSNLKPTKPSGRNAHAPNKADNIKDLQKEINDVLKVCKNIVTCNNDFMQKNVSKINSAKPTKSKNRAQEVTLEKVAQDMTDILKDLKDHLPAFKTGKDSFSDVVPKLEESFLKRNKKVGDKGKPSNGGKPQTACAPRTNTNACAKSGNKGSKTNAGPNPKLQNNTCKARPSTADKSKKSGGGSTMSASRSQNRPMSAMNQSNTCSGRGSANNSSAATNRAKPQSKLATSVPDNPNKKILPKAVSHPLELIRAEVDKAVREKKTFMVRGNFPAVRNSLLARGWIEKLHLSSRDQKNEKLKKFHTYNIQQLSELLWNKETADVCKKLIQSKLLATHQVDLYWSYNYNPFKECSDKIKLTKINKFRREPLCYTSKLGLCAASKRAAWFQIPGLANLNHPRTYSLTKNGDTPEFIRDFNRTAAMALLKWVVRNNSTGECKVLSPSGKIPIKVFDFAIDECYKFIKKAQHEDIDNDIEDAFDYEWTEFLEYFYKTVHIGNHFKKTNDVTEIDMVRRANFILKKINDFWPYLEMDGMMNLWILKPLYGSQGMGIHICRTLNYILKTVKANPKRVYIIQKYIERPLLIHNTKFDIRQWFLISSSVPLTIWMYKKCYLRFSSQTYNLRKLHEAIHLTNNSVQSRYKKSNRDIALPSYDMWYLREFKNYLSDIGYPNVYDTITYPGMKENIIAAVIMYQENLEKRKNCFELYGADFMLNEDFKPWLLEINASPALHDSTPVTATLCPAVLRDVIKVVIDYEANKSASTGDFELIYQNNLSVAAPNANFQVQGTPVPNDYFYTPSSEDKITPPPAVVEPEHAAVSSYANTPKIDAIDYVKHIGQGMRKTLEDLLEILKKEKEKRHKRKNKSVVTILSRIITESKESQTEYRDYGRLSETLISSQILEVEEPINLEKASNRTVVTPQSSPVHLGVEGYKPEKDDSFVGTGSEKRKTNRDRVQLHDSESVRNAIKIELQKIKMKNKKLQQNINQSITMIESKKNPCRGYQETGKAAKATTQSSLYREKEKETGAIIQLHMKINRDPQDEESQESEEERNNLQTMSDIIGKYRRNENEIKIISQSKSDTIKNFHEKIKEKISTHFKLYLDKKHQGSANKIKTNVLSKESVERTNSEIQYVNGGSQEITKNPTVCQSKSKENDKETKTIPTEFGITEKPQGNEKESFNRTKSDITRNLQENVSPTKTSPRTNGRHKEADFKTDHTDFDIVKIRDNDFGLFTTDSEQLEFNFRGSKLSKLLMQSNNTGKTKGTPSPTNDELEHIDEGNSGERGGISYSTGTKRYVTELNQSVFRKTFLKFILRAPKRT